MPGLIGIGLSAGLALVVTIVAGLIAGAKAPAITWAGPPALGLGYALGHAAVRGWLKGEWPTFPPLDVTDWVPFLALAAMVLGSFEAAAPSPAWARWENRLLLAAGSLWALLHPLFNGTWQPREGAIWLASIGAAQLIVWGVMETRARQLGRAMIPPMVILAAGTAAVLLLSHSLVLGELAATLAVALVAICLVSLWRPGLTLARGGVPVVVTVLTGLLVLGRFYAYPEVSAPAVILLAVSPLTLWIDLLGPVRRLGAWKAGLVRAVAIFVPVAIAVGLTLVEWLKAGTEGY